MIGMTVCSGIGAPEVAAPWIDWRIQAEIEKFPSAVLAERFPNVVNLGDMTRFKEWPDAKIDILVGGTPCQSFSVAGLRKGLDDPRGNLMLTFLAIARKYRPRWVVWENVPGVLSSNGGRDFGTFLRAMEESGYGWAYRVLDAQYVRTPGFPHAVPQRRRRVFVVGCLGDWARAAAVLFEPEGLRGDPPPRREAGQGSALGLASGVAIRGREGGGTAELTGDVATALRASQGGGDKPHVLLPAGVSPTLRAGGNKTGGDRPPGTDVDTCETLIPSVANPLTARMHKGINTTLDEGQTPIPIAFSSKDYGADAESNLSPTLRAGGHDGSHANAGVPPAIAIQERAVSENPNAGPDGAGVRADGAAYTLEARQRPQAVAFDLNQITSAANRSQPDPAVHHTLPATTCPPHLASPYAVRRLTPTECERLQGFPDCWTDIPWRGKPAGQCPDGPRYKALGNSWAVNCGEFVFERLRAVEEMANG